MTEVMRLQGFENTLKTRVANVLEHFVVSENKPATKFAIGQLIDTLLEEMCKEVGCNPEDNLVRIDVSIDYENCTINVSIYELREPEGCRNEGT